MKKILILMVVSMSFILAGDSVTKYKVDGLRCSINCCNKVKAALQDTKGVKNCDVDFDNKVATVTYDNSVIDGEKIKDVLKSKTEFKISQIEPESMVKKKSFFQRLFNFGS